VEQQPLDSAAAGHRRKGTLTSFTAQSHALQIKAVAEKLGAISMPDWDDAQFEAYLAKPSARFLI
jgi:hypothetical protein